MLGRSTLNAGRSRLGARGVSTRTRSCPTSAVPAAIKIVEVGPRDGLQNEKSVLPTELKVELIRRLVDVGLRDIEAGSFVSPKWVPQMATTSAVLSSPVLRALSAAHPALSLPVLVPNAVGLNALLALIETLPSPAPTSEIAIFVAASESFSRANLNCSIRESIDRLAPVVEQAKANGIKVRGYVSVVAGCPFEGRIDPAMVTSITKELADMGCYEVSLGDTIGVGTPATWTTLLEQLGKSMDVSKLAAHCHDTYGTSIASILTCISHGITTVDTSIAGLGGCPYSPGATGNVATEDVVYALESSGIVTGLLPPPNGAPNDLLVDGSPRGLAFVRLAEVGEWVSREIGRENASRAGRAALARARRSRDLAKKAKL